MRKDFSKWREGRRSTGCYYITKKGMKKIYDNYESNFIPKSYNPADHFIYKVLNKKNVSEEYAPVFSVVYI